ncbi:triose-phosphate transporter family-domain-containing protein [Lipomyces kononenkoae]|uniref:Triose-phosphate transporter family-domain-containing protein n=1 Tax=Lipomyces kononenkoae TaxID=34357 RepID=A0ACC3T8G2_LIPKO
MGAEDEVKPTTGGAGLLLSSTFKAKSYTNSTAIVLAWIAISSSVILFNKAILYNSRFPFPIFLTTWHLVFSALATQILCRTTNLYSPQSLDISKSVYLRRIIPIAIFYSLALVCSNQAYMYLNISFIQMLKATTPVAVFIVSYVLRQETFRLDVLENIWIIVFGVFVASFGEINFSVRGVAIEMTGILCEALRLVMMNRLLHSSDDRDVTVYNSKKGQGQPMDPFICLYYFSPICAVANLLLFLISDEAKQLTFAAIQQLGFSTLLLNGFIAFMLNVSVVFLIGRTSSLVLSLCGILKDIILVVVSAMFWKTQISRIQVVGYLITLVGLFGYKFGYSPILVMARAADRQGYKKYYSTMTVRARKRVATACLLMSLFAAGLFYYSQTIWIGAGVTDGAFDEVQSAIVLAPSYPRVVDIKRR